MFKYEINKMKAMFFPLLFSAMIAEIITMGGGFAIGYFDREADDVIFEHYNSLLGLTLLIASLFVSVYCCVLACKYIVNNYLNDNKVRLYLFPEGRGKLFFNKFNAFLLIAMVAELMGFFITSLLFLIVTRITNTLPSDVNYLQVLLTIITCALFSIFVVSVSSVLGIFFTSKVTTIVTSVIMITIMSNPLSFLCSGKPIGAFMIALILILVSLALILWCCKYLDNDELLR